MYINVFTLYRIIRINDCTNKEVSQLDGKYNMDILEWKIVNAYMHVVYVYMHIMYAQVK